MSASWDLSILNLESIIHTYPNDVQSIVYISLLSVTFICGLVYRYPVVLVWMYQRWNIVSTGFRVKRVKVRKNYFISYVERGTMKTSSVSVLMFHGFSATKDSFCQIAKHLPKNYHVIIIDMPGHGETTKRMDEDFKIQGQVKRIKQFVDATKLSRRKFHVIGTSMGGHIAGVYAAKFPRDVKSVSMLCPAGVKAARESDMIKTYFEEGKICLLPETVDELIEMLKYVFHKKYYFPRFFLRGVLNDRKTFNPWLKKILFDIVHEDCRYYLEECLPKIRAPSLVIWGKEDKTLDVSAVDVIKAKLPKSRIEIFENCGHSIFFEEPSKAGQCLNKFYRSL